jgi:hypothetical protein
METSTSPGIRLSLVPLRIHARTGSSGLFAPFWPLAFLLSTYQSGRWLVGAVGIEFTSLHSKSRKRNDVAPPPLSNWSLLEPSNRGSVVFALPFPSISRYGRGGAGSELPGVGRGDGSESPVMASIRVSRIAYGIGPLSCANVLTGPSVPGSTERSDATLGLEAQAELSQSAPS